MDSGQEVAFSFVMTDSDGAEVLALEKKGFGEAARLVTLGSVATGVSLLLLGAMTASTCWSLSRSNTCSSGVVRFIGQPLLGFEVEQQEVGSLKNVIEML